MTTLTMYRHWCRKEVDHLVGHDPNDPDVPAHGGIAEVEAESVAAFVLAAYGVDSSDYTVPYVSTWASRVKGVDPVTAVQQTAGRVRTIALQIIDGFDTQMVPDGDPPCLDRTLDRKASGRRSGPTTPSPAASAHAAVVDDGLTRRTPHPSRTASAALTDGLGR